MATEKIEYDIVINGKQAKKTIDDVDKKQKQLDKTTTTTTKSMSMNWKAVGASIAASAVVLAAMTKQAANVEKAMFGLNDQMKEYAIQTSITSDFTTEQVAGFIKTAETAGVATSQIAKLVDMGIALGRAYPHESTETLIDNLVMLNKTGEAQGFIVDILEQKYGLLDLNTLTLAEKMAALEEKTSGVNKEFQSLASSKLSTVISAVGVAIEKVGTKILKVIDKLGVFDTIIDKFKEWGLISKEVNKALDDTNKNMNTITATGNDQLNMWDNLLAGVAKFANEHKRTIEKAKIEQQELEQVGKNAMSNFENAMVQAAKTGRFEFSKMTQAILDDLLKIMIRQKIVRPLASSIGGVDFGGSSGAKAAQGAVLNGQSPVQKRFATGGVVNRPTRFANGGMVGERNRAEAILPLERTASGDLGVKAMGGGSNVVVNIENQTGFGIDSDSIVTSTSREEETINIVLKGINNNTQGIRDLLKNT